MQKNYSTLSCIILCIPVNRHQTLTVYSVVALACSLALTISCGSDDSSAPAAPSVDESTIVTIGDDADISAQTRPNAVYGYDVFVQAGWKQHQVYDTATLPEAESARYGFFNRRDVEIRLYPNNASALGAGVGSAEEAIDRQVHDGSGFASRRVYGAYLVAGNAVMLCEVQVADCLNLLEAVQAQQ